MLMGFQGEAFIGTAGSTGATRLSNSTDITLDVDIEEGNTTPRGDSSEPPIDTTAVTIRKWSAQVSMLNETSDTALETFRVAATNGTPIAFRLKDYSSGKGYDGDVNVKYSHAKPLRGEQSLQFTVTPNRSLRVPQLYV